MLSAAKDTKFRQKWDLERGLNFFKRRSHRDDGSLRGVTWQVPEALISHLDQLFVLDCASSDDNHAGCGVVSSNIILQVLSRKAADVLRRPEDRTPKPALLEAHLVEVV